MAPRDPVGPGSGERCGNLPIQLSSFVGRTMELAELRQLLDRARLVTLTGSAGSGKTRLALQLASSLQSEYPDGVWFIELAAVVEGARVPQAIASVLGVQEEVGRTLFGTLLDHQRSRCSLLLLDNCEHLVEACAELVLGLLGSSAGLRVLATSRESLHLPGEAIWLVPPMTLPPSGESTTMADLLESEAVHLFAERAALLKPSFRLTDRTAPIVARICRRLDGMPLAIELAAARLRVLSVDEIDERLESRFRLLRGGGPVAIRRQQTLRAAIDWSYGLLSEQETLLFNRLAIFAGGFTLESAEAICAGEGIASEDVLDGLSRLVDKSMLVADEPSDGSTRYRLLETLREYGLERLRDRGEYERLGEAHASHFLKLSVLSEDNLTGPNQAIWLGRLQRDLDNLRAALRWWHSHDPDQGLRMAAALAMFWYMSGQLSEGRQQLEATLEVASDSRSRAAGLYGLGLLEHRHAKYERARLHFEAAQPLFQAVADDRGVGRCLMRSGKTVFELGDFDTARERLEEARGMLSAAGDQWGVAQTLHDLGVLHGEHGLRDYDQATPYYREALAMRRGLGDRHATGFTLFSLSYQPGPLPERKAYLHEALQNFQDLEDGVGIALALESFACLAAVTGHPRRAIRLLAAAQSQRERVGGASPHRLRLGVEETVDAVRRRLDSAEGAGLEAEGHAMSLQEAIEVATEDWDEAPELSGARQRPAGPRLTKREVEVARMVAEGLTNREIASRLFISHRTAEYHVEQIRNKLGFQSRAQVAGWCVAVLGYFGEQHLPPQAATKNR